MRVFYMQCATHSYLRVYMNVYICGGAQHGKAWENYIERPGFTAGGETTE